MIRNHLHDITHRLPVWKVAGAFMVCYTFMKTVEYLFDKVKIVVY